MGALTFLIPGLAQFSAGKTGKGLALLLGAIFGGALSGGLIWLLCGAWSFWEYHGLSKGPATPAQTSQAPTPTQASPPPAPTPAAHGDFRVAALKYGTALIGMAMILAYANHKGLTFKVLDLVGLVKVEFHDSKLASAGRAESLETTPRTAAEAVPVRAAQVRPPMEESRRVEVGSPSPDAILTDLEGQWNQPDGGEYRIFQSENTVQIKEFSKFLFLPVETADCRGELQGARVRARCQTIFDTQGEMNLVLSQDRKELAGTYTDALTGVSIALTINR